MSNARSSAFIRLLLATLLSLACAKAPAAVTVRLLGPELTNDYVGADDSASQASFQLDGRTEIIGANGRSFSSIASGQMKARIEAWEFRPNGQFFMNWGLKLENRSFTEQLILPVGALSFAVDGRFLRQQGLFGIGDLSTELRASIYVTGSGTSADEFRGNLVYRGWENTSGVEETTFDTATNNINAIVSARLSDDDFAVSFSNARPLVVDAGDLLEIDAELSLDVYMNLSGSPVGFYALLDAGDSASLSLILPEGVRLLNPPPGLAWVSVVPEPPSVLFAALGLAGLGGLHRMRMNLRRPMTVRT
jgi:hypothetical protein